ncbi:ead/Ea22-like family protein [Salmonella enterica subsp. enterica serovar Rubislaw]|nr:ead/Ea22-like family protein [Salmonella enterica subsp. enterica serovar Rubislaw]
MTIDKQALREAAEKATPGPWEMEQENIWFTDEDGYTKHLVYVQQGDDVDDKQDHYNTAFIAAANPATMLALLDELDKKQQYIKLRDQENEDIALTVGKLRVELEHYKSREERVTKLVLDNSTSWDVLYEKLEAAEKRIAEQREYYEGVIADGSKRIAELENSETQLINERDAAESALADMYQAATGERPEWSNMFGFSDAVDVVEERLATLEANQSQTTPTGIQLITEAIGAHGYIVGCLLQGRPDLALEESRKWVSAFGQAAEIVSAQDAAGIKVKGE